MQDRGDPKPRKLKDKDHPAEARVANRLCVHEFRAVFVDDEVPVLKEETGRLRIIGLPDLDTGLEIKNVQSAKSENTISKHIGKAKRKQGYRQIVIDVSENPNISDEEARGMIASSLRRHSMPSALMVNHGGGVEAVYNPKKIKKGLIPLRRHKALFYLNHTTLGRGGTGRRVSFRCWRADRPVRV